MRKLYNGPTSVCSIKVRVTLDEIGLEYENVMVNLQKGEQFDPAYLKLNPAGVVPTLVDDDLIVVESSLIIEYLDKIYNESRLMPKDVALEVRTRHWLLRCIAIHGAVNTLTFSTVNRTKTLETKTPEEIEAAIVKMPDPVNANKRRDLYTNGLQSVYVTQALLHLHRAFADMSTNLNEGAWVSGPEFGLSDLGLMSYIDRLDRLGFAGLWDDFPQVGTWLTAMRARPSYSSAVLDFIPEKTAQVQRAGGAKHWPELSKLWRNI